MTLPPILVRNVLAEQVVVRQRQRTPGSKFEGVVKGVPRFASVLQTVRPYSKEASNEALRTVVLPNRL